VEGDTHYLVLFDGYCNLCSGAVQFIIRRDKRKRFTFAALTGPTATAALSHSGNSGPGTDSIILFEKGERFDRSTAALRIARHLDGAWPLFYGLIILPRPIRDAVYEYVAKKRYRWFGHTDTCWLPTPEWKDRFPDP
jgi:predicted DCC family thiol-disulfide oxidoreductase YuxK